MLMTFVNYDTPKYYIIKKKYSRAKEVMSGIYKAEFVDQQLK
jgi:hypothetical protein